MSLAQWLSTAKHHYLHSTATDDPSWTVVMGNEAGDLDSIASSIAYAWILSNLHNRPSIPLLRLTTADLHLRKENTHALALAGISPADLLFSPDLRLFPSTTFALVDHNRLAPEFTHQNTNPRILAVVDHHADEGLYPDARPRLIAPAGSCASHIAALSPPALPPHLATLLLCAICIDTDGARPGGKALPADYAALAFLAPLSPLAAGALHASWLPALAAELSAQKADVGALGAHDLLRRDYKLYALCTGASAQLVAGLASVPLRLSAWAAEGQAAQGVTQLMDERGVGVLGVLTSFWDGEKHRREQMWVVRPTVVDALRARLWEGLEGSAELRLTREEGLDTGIADGEVRVYKQKNAHATRKVTAPLLRSIVEA